MALCINCRKQYLIEAADTALEGNKPPEYEDWIKTRLLGFMPELEATYRMGSERLAGIQKLQEEKLQEMLASKLSGQNLTQDILRAARLRLRETDGEKVWRSLDGPKAYREFKIGSARIQEARRLLKDLEAKKNRPNEAEAKNTTTDTEPESETEPKLQRESQSAQRRDKKSSGRRAKIAAARKQEGENAAREAMASQTS
jgi:hypothetical protein